MDTDMATDTDMAIRTTTTSSHQTLSPIKKDLPTEVLFFVPSSSNLSDP